MPIVARAQPDTISYALRFDTWRDLVEVGAEPVTYTVPSDSNMLLVKPVKQSDGSSTTVYYTSGPNAIGSAITGIGFGNQPNNDGIEILSSSALDTTQSITLYYTRDSLGDTLNSETILLTGTSAVALTHTDASLLCGAELDAACAGTITIREASGNATITTIAPAALQSGVTTLTDTDAGDSFVRLVGNDTTTKQIGLVGTDPAGAALLDSQALTNTTSVLSNSRFGTVTKVLHGDLESNRTVTLSAQSAYVPTATETDGSAPFPIDGSALLRVIAGSTISFARADSGVTVNVGLMSWHSRPAPSA